MTSPSITAAAWTSRFREIDDCPWPGPRPLTADEAQCLIGREKDIEAITNEVASHRLVILAGLSGIGKSSLIAGGLVNQLRASGRTTVVCRDWTREQHRSSAYDFLGAKIAEELRSTLPAAESKVIPEGAEAFVKMAEQFGSRGIIILDQFEELIRDAPDFKGQIFDLIANVNEQLPLKVIISLRTEYLHELRALERMLSPFSTSTIFLQEVNEERAQEIASTPTEPHAIADDGVVQMITNLWRQAAAATSQFSEGRIGLIHLQAMLYVLHGRSQSPNISSGPGDDVVLQPINGLVFEQWRRDWPAEVVGESEPIRSVEVCHLALQQAVELKLGRCREAAEQVQLDRSLVQGSTDVMLGVAPHLSSGGYKLIRSTLDLFIAAGGERIGRLLEQCGFPQKQKERDRALTELLHGTLALLTDRNERDLLTAERLEIWPASLDLDKPSDLSAGPMRGLPARQVLVEESRRFALAMLWMQESALLRISSPGDNRTMVSLIHDRFGDAFSGWAETHRSTSSAGPVHAITEVRAAKLVWPDEQEGVPVLEEFGRTDADDSPHRTRTLVNLIWPGCYIRATFRNVTFVNCDFRGTYFSECSFTGVAFVNCLLDGAMFSRCSVHGPQPQIARDRKLVMQKRFPSEYWIADTAEESALLRRYNPSVANNNGDTIIAAFPGHPARVGASNETTTEARTCVGRLAEEVESDVSIATNGSLLILGGRLASLGVFDMRFDSQSALCLWETAGSGFNVTGHREFGNYDIRNSALRHLSFVSGEPGVNAELHLTIHDSAIHQIWCDDAIPGRLTCTDSQLLDVWPGGLTPDVSASVDLERLDRLNIGNQPLDARSHDEVRTRAQRIDGHDSLDAEASP